RCVHVGSPKTNVVIGRDGHQRSSIRLSNRLQNVWSSVYTFGAVAVVTPLRAQGEAYVALQLGALAGPRRLYARLREGAPVYEFGTAALITRYADVSALLLDQERVHNGAPSRGIPPDVLARLSDADHSKLADIIDWESRWLTSSNGERHAELRSLGTRV